MRRSRILVLLVAAIAGVTAACSSSGSSPPSATPTQASASPASTTPTEPIVGRWQRTTTCQELVADLTKAGLQPLVPYAWLGQTSAKGESSFASGSPKPTMSHPCTGAIARLHSHFFDQHGQFGSLDWTGGQVDDGPYRIIDDHTIQIGSPGTTFHYKVQGDTLTLDPVITQTMLSAALAKPQDFSDAGWAVSVAYPGSTWTRAACGTWC
jgi:hypothetical protein